MIKLGLIGISISQSRAPSLHTTLGEMFNIPVTYELFDLSENTPEAFEATLKQLIDQGYTGTNVTFPFKQVATGYTSSVNTAVEKMGATNTLRLQGGVAAFNTDYTGFIRGYRGRCGDQPAGKVLMIGAGGVGRAVAFGLFELGATELLVCDMNVASAESLVQALAAYGYKASVVAHADVADAARGVDGLVNCTPVGHYKTPGNPLPLDAFGGQRWAFDAVYTPLDTEFLIAAADKGLQIVSGFDLFFYQGVDAFEIFTGFKVEDDQAALRHFMKKFDIQSKLLG
ncbi:shikimate dehydrogenase family protein [Parathalassolituus penaei]|uniref:Shikimate dehydrogenase n=1 Tax=Parathalassolituus penaei TaxID=2997323 RepID=A0A9X3ITM0_9GAMM|nr:shikimate dehydrogenase [Parathalassolituus penaei]MCY0967041.1 shikimate dehydrogenase [Parathalassolituus penaei]